MIHEVRYLDRLRWRLSLFIIEKCGEGKEAAEALTETGCRGAELAEAVGMIDSCGLNVGLTFSNRSRRNTIMMIGMAETPEQTMNTIIHETHHITTHICVTDGIDVESEEAADVAGCIGMEIYDIARSSRLL